MSRSSAALSEVLIDCRFVEARGVDAGSATPSRRAADFVSRGSAVGRGGAGRALNDEIEVALVVEADKATEEGRRGVRSTISSLADASPSSSSSVDSKTFRCRLTSETVLAESRRSSCSRARAIFGDNSRPAEADSAPKAKFDKGNGFVGVRSSTKASLV